MTDEAVKTSSRRSVLKALGLGVGAAGVASAMTSAPVSAKTVGAPATQGYQETDHVKTYYDLARF